FMQDSMKPQTQPSLGRLCALTAALVVVSAALLALRQSNSSKESSLAPSRSVPIPRPPRANETNRLPPLSHLEKLQQRMLRLLAALEEETGPMAFESRAAMAQETVESLAADDLPAALSIVAGLQGSEPTEAGQVDLELRLVQRWGEQDIYPAARWCANAPLAIQEEACRRIAALWAATNPIEANSWASQIPDLKVRESALLAVGAEIANNSPIIAIEICSALPASLVRDEVLS